MFLFQKEAKKATSTVTFETFQVHGVTYDRRRNEQNVESIQSSCKPSPRSKLANLILPSNIIFGI